MASLTVVQINVPPEGSFGVTLNRVRSWLNANRIRPADFRSMHVPDGVAFKLSFRSEDDARRFEEQFH
jgi:hypothetical protein